MEREREQKAESVFFRKKARIKNGTVFPVLSYSNEPSSPILLHPPPTAAAAEAIPLSLSRRICEHGVLQPSLLVCSCLLGTSSVMANPPSSSQASSIFPAVETNTLPQDLLLEILLRLPVKSLVRFRAVHPSWQSLFQNPNFISAHFRHSNLLRPRKVLCVEFFESEEEKDEKTAFSLFDEKTAFSLFDDTLDAVDTSEISNEMFPVGTCNGVFCFTDWLDRNKFLLWNPATRETMVLPPPLIPETDQCDCDAVGFGLDPQGGDLKIVRLCEEDECFSAEVYSLKSRCWRKIQIDLEYITSNYGVDLCFILDDNHAYCNGSYHWVNRFGKMLSFDMTREVFEWGKLPRPARWWICAGLSGCLSAMTPVNTGMEVWSMVGAKSWKPVKRFELKRFFQKRRPVWWDNDEVLFHLCFLNITRQEVREVRVPGVECVLQLFPYAESLVSIGNS